MEISIETQRKFMHAMGNPRAAAELLGVAL